MNIVVLSKIEFQKLLTRFNSIYLSAVILIIVFQVWIIVRIESGLAGGHVTNPATIYSLAGKYVNNIIFIAIPLLYIINLSREFENYITHRFLFSGMSRWSYLVSKFINAFYLSVAGAVIVLFFRVLVSILYHIPLMVDSNKPAIAFMIAFYLCIFFGTFVFIFRRTGYVILFFFAYILVESIVVAYLQSKGMKHYLPFSKK